MRFRAFVPTLLLISSVSAFGAKLPIGCIEYLYPSLPSDAECAAPTATNKDACALRAEVVAERAKPGLGIPMPR